MGFPDSKTRGFPGSRVDPYRAGITTTTLAKLILYLSRHIGNNFASPGVPMIYKDEVLILRGDAITSIGSGQRIQLFACEGFDKD
jgi:hypothetical protein